MSQVVYSWDWLSSSLLDSEDSISVIRHRQRKPFLPSPLLVRDAHAFANATSSLHFNNRYAASRYVMMIDPEGFRVNEEAISVGRNRFMSSGSTVDCNKAFRQFYATVAEIRSIGIPVRVFPGKARYPDGIFPNNVFAAVEDLSLVLLGNMRLESRKGERERADIHDWFREQGYAIVDLSRVSAALGIPVTESAAELTGNLVIDRARNVAYLGLSNRFSPSMTEAVSRLFALRLVYEFPLRQNPYVYHTNIVLSILAGEVCVISRESFERSSDADAIAAFYGEKVLWLREDQVEAMCGNILCLGDSHVFLSLRAYEAFDIRQRELLKKWGFTLHPVDISELEKGGGSMRCLLMELW